MKKKILKVVIIIVIICLSIAILAFISDKVLNTSDFPRVMENNEFKVENVISKYEKNSDIVHAYEATEKDNKYAITYLEFTSNNAATDYFETEKEALNKTKDKNAVVNYSALNDNEKYSINTDSNHYKTLSKIANTVVYFDVESKYSEEVVEILNKIGY